jgi:hypothetical protein
MLCILLYTIWLARILSAENWRNEFAAASISVDFRPHPGVLNSCSRIIQNGLRALADCARWDFGDWLSIESRFNGEKIVREPGHSTAPFSSGP